jgi:glutamine amidotransferase
MLQHAHVFDYGGTRARRLLHALRAAGVDPHYTRSVKEAKKAQLLVLPDACDHDETLKRGIREGTLELIERHVALGLPLLALGTSIFILGRGISQPGVYFPGIGLFDAQLYRFRREMVDTDGAALRTPNAGFGYVVGLHRHPYLRTEGSDDAKGQWLYFRNRWCLSARVQAADVAVMHHGFPFAGAIWRDNVLACQFLPELSGRQGIEVLAKWCGKAVA